MTQNMDLDPLNVSLRKFLKQVGVTSQRAIELAVERGALRGRGRLTVRAVVTAEEPISIMSWRAKSTLAATRC